MVIRYMRFSFVKEVKEYTTILHTRRTEGRWEPNIVLNDWTING